jgi:hypothetical protein
MVMRTLKILCCAVLAAAATQLRAESMTSDAEPPADDTMIGPRSETPPPQPNSPAQPVVDDEEIVIKLVAPRRPNDSSKKQASIAAVAAAVDSAIEANLRAMNITPEELCDDHTFIRRVTLDLTGQIPSVAEIGAFLAHPAGDRRASKIAELIKEPEYADHWASFWTTVLVGRARQGFGDQAPNRLRRWLYEHLKNNTPYDQIVEQLLTATGKVAFDNPFNKKAPGDYQHDSPAIVYLGHHLQSKGLPETAGHVTRTFLGMRMGCAQCHDHPFDKWTQQDFWKMTAFLSNTSGSEYYLSDNDTRITAGTYEPPEPGLKMLPTLPGYAFSNFTEEALPQPQVTPKLGEFSKLPTPEANRPLRGATFRKELAKWVTNPLNENFDREAVNRIWRSLLGHGLVEQVDDLREKNPPTHPEAMELLANDFNSSGRDLRRLIAIIASTHAYQRSSFGQAFGKDRLLAVRYAARAEVRPMTPEMMFSAVLKISGGAQKAKTFLDGLNHTSAYNRSAGNSDVLEFYNILQRFEPDGGGGDETASANQFEGTVTFALTMMHAPLIQRLLRSGSINRNIEALFASALCRPPTPSEKEACAKLRNQDDLVWVLVNSAEFVTIH